MAKEPQIFQHYEKVKKQRNFFRKLAWLGLLSLIGISVLSFWHQWFLLTFYILLVVIGFIFQVIIFLKNKEPGSPSA
jgi:CHASE2 domain-containing sensor protein